MWKTILFLCFCGLNSLLAVAAESGPNVQEAEQINAETSNLKSIRMIPTGKKLFYPNPANYKDFKYHALIIGVDITPVKGSGSTCHVPFALQLSEFLKKWRCFSKGSIIVLKGGDATKQRIKEAITSFRLGPKDVLIIYYGGHGDYGGLVTSDKQGLLPEDLSSYMQQSGAGFKVLLISACYSGIFVLPEDKGHNFQQTGFAVVTSGEESGTSTYKGIGFGPYLWELLNLKTKGPNRVVTLGEFVNFIKRKNIFWKKQGKYRLSNGRNFGPKDSVVFWD